MDRPEGETTWMLYSLCENNDKFAINHPLLRAKSVMYTVIHDTGAHGFSMVSLNAKLFQLKWKKTGNVRMIAQELKDQKIILRLYGFDF